MDPFQIRLDCVALLRRLTASQQSIAKVVDYAIRHAPLASDDIWDCIVTECSKTTLNNRLNILFLIDSLLLQIVDPIGFSSSSTGNSSSSSSSSPSTVNLAQAAMAYLGLATRDIRTVIVQGVVPLENWDAIRLNATSTEKVLVSWKRLNIFNLTTLDELIEELKLQKTKLSKLPFSIRVEFPKKDILRRIDEDRERHKRLRERAWILPAKSFMNGLDPIKSSTSVVVSRQMKTGNNHNLEINSSFVSSANPDALEVEFDFVWDNLGDFDKDDLEKIREDDAMWWGTSRQQESRNQQIQQKKQKNTSLTTPSKRKVDEMISNNTSYDSTGSWSNNKRFHQKRT